MTGLMIRSFGFIALCAVLLSACGGKNLHFSQEGIDASVKPKTRANDFIEKRWSYSLGSNFSAQKNVIDPAVERGTVFAASSEGQVVALELSNGNVLWRNSIEQRLTAGVGVGDGLVTIATENGEVVALNSADGLVSWITAVDGEVLATPVVVSGVVVVRVGDSRIVGLDTATGKILWNVQKNVIGLSVRGVSSPLINGRGAVSGLADGRLIAVDIDSGNILWETNVGRRKGNDRVQQLTDIDSNPALFGTVLYVAAFQSRIVAMALGSPRVIWSADVSTIKNIGVDADSLYVIAETGVVTGLNRFTGEVQWSQHSLKGRGLSPAVASGDNVMLGDFEGYLYNLDRTSGELLGSKRLAGGAIVSTPLRVDGTLLILTEGGRLHALKHTP